MTKVEYHGVQNRRPKSAQTIKIFDILRESVIKWSNETCLKSLGQKRAGLVTFVDPLSYEWLGVLSREGEI